MNRNPLCRALAATLLGLLTNFAQGAARDATSPFRPVSQTETSWTYDYTASPLHPGTITVDGLPHRLYSGGETGDEAGHPLLPTEFITLGVPYNTTITAELKDASYTDEPNVLVAPSPAFSRTEEGEALPSYAKDAIAYAQDQFVPSATLGVEGPYTVRSARMVTIRISPIQYNPRARVLRRLSHATLVVHLQSTSPKVAVPALQSRNDPHFESAYRSLMANYEQADEWRYRMPATAAQDSTGAWFTPGATYVRLPVSNDGLYRVTPGELAALGVMPDISTVKIQFRGEQIPLQIDAEAMYFYGSRKRGDSTYRDYYTDTSAYWLSWHTAGSPRRFEPVPNLNITPADTQAASRTTVHFEEDKDYYEGTGDAEVTLNGQAPGEGWAWEYFYPNTLVNHDFTLDNVWRIGDTTVTLRVRLYSTTLNYNTPDHVARFWMNDSLLGELSFNGRKEGLYRVSFPVRLLKEGTNRLSIQSIPTASSPNQFYLDWFELDYVRAHVARSGQLICSISPRNGVADYRITTRGFPSSMIRVLDLNNGRILQDIAVAPEGGGTYTVQFDDTLRSERRYLVAADSSAMQVQGLARKTFAGLRQNTAGADYIILTHSLFRSAANILAAHRQVRNSVRTAVVDVQDVYDEFNYGHISSESIKAFLRYTYDNWPSPAPAHVLMFGDASWDYRHSMATTTMTNYVPAYGVPAGDNWYVCFDTAYSFLPSMTIGRLPVQNAVQAGRLVEKVIGYDAYSLGDWNKNFLFISGGTTPAERVLFDGQSNALIQDIVLPPPIGGTPFKVYKTTPNAIDGEHREELRALVREGLMFMNFLGHSGGRVWGVDIGSPATLENTTGMLPFVSSVSCNVGAFAEPSNNVLSEDFVLADSRGAIAMWASSSLGYANVGASLVRFFLEAVRNDTARALGETTTAARIKTWLSRGNDYITRASLDLNPLIGDPLSSLAIPRKPDLALSTTDLTLDQATPTTADTIVHVRAAVHNFGLVPADSVELSLTDLSSRGIDSVFRDFRIRKTLHRDTVLIPWHGTSTRGFHRLHVDLDPRQVVNEVREDNNSASVDAYVYTHAILGVRPLQNEVLRPGQVDIVVSPPVSGDTTVTAYQFELDTSSSFASGAHMVSGSVQPGPVGGRWTTPTLSAPGVYFWRARTVVDTLVGRWTMARFAIAPDAPSRPTVQWREEARGQFTAGVEAGTSSSDTGVTLRVSPSLLVGARSLGYLANADKDYYSTLRVNEQRVYGLWWEYGSSFMVMRLNAFTGTYIFKAFNIAGDAALADSMKSFLDATNVGDYVLITVIFDGYTNVSAGLRASIQALGSTQFESVRPGHSWMLIARKQTGPPFQTLEQWSSTGVAEDSTLIPNNYAIGSGIYSSVTNPFPSSFGTLRWTPQVRAGTHTMRGSLLGIRADGTADTLTSIAASETERDLSGLGTKLRDSSYTQLGFSVALSTNDASSTPVLRNWAVDFEPPPDMAISGKTVGSRVLALAKSSGIDIPLTIHNIGYQTADSARIRVDLLKQNGGRQALSYATSGRIPVDSLRTVLLSIPADGLAGNNDLEIIVSPPARTRDLLAENNTARVNINFTSVSEPLAATVRVYADGVPLMDGDYVSSQPQLLVQLEELTGVRSGQERVSLYVDNKAVMSNVRDGTGAALHDGFAAQGTADADGFTFAPDLKEGPHEIAVRLYRWNGFSGVDSIEHRVAVNVVNDSRILRVLNYPNPFSASTEFTFVLTGTRAPEELIIRIFTIAGRRIQEIRVPHTDLRVGFNRVPWDGRDSDGDEIANGYYLYQVQAKGEGKVESAIEKMAKVR